MIKIWNISFLLISSIKQKLWIYNLLQSLLIFFWALSICNKKSRFNEISLENKDNLTPISVDTLWFANIVSSIIIFQSISLSSDRLFDFWFEIFFTIYLIQQFRFLIKLCFKWFPDYFSKVTRKRRKIPSIRLNLVNFETFNARKRYVK